MYENNCAAGRQSLRSGYLIDNCTYLTLSLTLTVTLTLLTLTVTVRVTLTLPTLLTLLLNTVVNKAPTSHRRKVRLGLQVVHTRNEKLGNVNRSEMGSQLGFNQLLTSMLPSCNMIIQVCIQIFDWFVSEIVGMLNDNRKIDYRNRFSFSFSCLYYRFSKWVRVH